MIALLGAMKEELGTIEKQMNVARKSGGDGFDALEGEYRGRNVLLVRTGVGRKRVEKALDFTLGTYPLEAVISLGFAGGLAEGIKGGDVVVCRGSRCSDGAGEDQGKTLLSDPRLVSLVREMALKQGVETRLGDGVTVSRAAYSPEEKRRLGKDYAALMVEMEGYWTAKMAMQKGIPFLNLRAISDPVEEPLPPIGHLMDLSSGSWNKSKAFFYLMSHPRYAIPLLKMFASFRKGRQNLSALLGPLVEGL